MKIRKIMHAVLLSGLCSGIVTTGVFGQQSSDWTETESERNDSVRVSNAAEELELKEDKENLSDLEAERSDTKEKAQAAKRVERDAYDAARESRNAYRTEKRAQKARKAADRQAEKASKARKISDRN